MVGIDMDKPMVYKNSSFRFFEENERHVTRICRENVLLLVFDGALRFTEDGVKYELHHGQYHIQKANTFQTGDEISDSPRYLYIHFLAEFTQSENALPLSGEFNCGKLKPAMERLDRLSHEKCTLIEQTAVFYEILSALYRSKTEITTAGKIAEYIAENCARPLTLETIAKEFNFSKNHIINIFKKEFKVTPFEYLNRVRINRAEQLLEVTSRSVESICCECGFKDYSHFYKLFYRANHISPGRWRTQKR